MSVLSALRNGPDSDIVKHAEGRVSGFWAQFPIRRPEEIKTKGGPCKLMLKYLGEHDQITRDKYLLEEELQYLYTYPKRSVSDEEKKRAVRGLCADATVREYLKKHPEDASSFGLNGYRPDLKENDFKALSNIDGLLKIDGEEKKNVIRALCGSFRNEDEEKILEMSLVRFLIASPEVGKHLGDKALAFRIQATLKNLKDIDEIYKALLKKSRSELEKRKENGFPLWARAYHKVLHGLNKSIWWVRDNPILGLTAVVSVIVLLKLGIVLFMLDEVESGHRQNKSVPTPQPEPARAYRPQPPPYGPQAWPQPYSPQQNYPQPYNPPPAYSLQAPVYPAPYLEQTPTPLQTALNMPTA
jgi:hypothetical protein